jgi:hypothetical protein
MSGLTSSIVVASAGLLAACLFTTLRADSPQTRDQPAPPRAHRTADMGMFAPSSECLACHNNLVTPSGEDVSIGASWRASIMANSARDPYVLASVRRETIDHAGRASDIEDECATCHAPAAQKIAHAAGGKAQLFAHVASVAAGTRSPLDDVALDGVSCTICHQIAPDRLGSRESFNGNFVVAPPRPDGRRRAFGPFEVDAGRRRLMHSVTQFEQEEAPHIRESQLCATCHTLITDALGPDGRVIGSLPEQMNYQEWRHSSFFGEGRSCQSCHMPPAEGPVRVSSVLGDYRDRLARHTFLGGNAFMLRMMSRYRSELGVEATPAELEVTARATIRQLEQETATVAVDQAVIRGGTLAFDVVVTNLTGHKFPTGFPSRRAWLHVTVRDHQGRAVFESGGVTKAGSIVGNDSDSAAAAFEPHYEEITTSDAVQIYESIMGTPAGAPTTGLLQATQYLKDNRLLPRGFDKRTATREIAVVGAGAADADFSGEGDRVRYRIPMSTPVTIEVELRFQPIGLRWAQNLAAYDAPEPRRFLGYYTDLAAISSVVVARSSRSVAP